MKLSRLLLACMLMTSTPALANWTFEGDEDPLSDEKTGYLAIDGERSAVAFKCWAGDPDELMMMVIVPVPYDASATYKSAVDAQVRVDKGEVRDGTFSIREASGFLSFVTVDKIGLPVLETLAELRNAKQRLVLGFEGMSHTFPVRGSSKAVDAFVKQCALTLPAAPAAN
jgi:hypothetical protein